VSDRNVPPLPNGGSDGRPPESFGGTPQSSLDRISLIALLNALLRYRRVLLLLPLGCAVAAGLSRLVRDPEYTATTSFVPQSPDRPPAGLGGLAAQFGIAMPGLQPSESPEFYAELIKSRVILGPVAGSRFSVAHGAGQDSIALVELLEIDSGDPAERVDEALDRLKDLVSVSASAATDIVRVEVTTRWPHVSAGIAARTIDLVNDFNLRSKQTQAGSERRFVESRMKEVHAELTEAEADLQAFRQRNRDIRNSPELMLVHERLQRTVAWKQEVFTSLAQAFEQARIEEVRNLPVITIVESPVVPVRPDRRGTIRWLTIGFLVGLCLAAVVIFMLEVIHNGRIEEGSNYSEFERLKAASLDDVRRPWRILARRR
jgi:uncharacterized protein involved in exopolysaccharide biosynthesis